MSGSDSILVIVEPDLHPTEVIARATWLATLAKCDLHLLLCDSDIGPLREGLLVSNEARDIAREIKAAQAEMIEDLAMPARDAGLTVNTEVLDERPIADGVLHHAINLEPRFVVKGTDYHSAAERSIFVDTDWQLIRSCPFPLWLVKPHEIREHPIIVASVDPTHSHDKPATLDSVIVDAAQAVASAAGGEVHLFHTYHRLVGIGREATRTFKPIKLPVDELSKEIQEDHRARLEELADAKGIAEDRIHQLPGNTKELLPMFARTQGADLVVMGALARWGLKRAVLGSTTERTLDQLPCDVLIVRQDSDD